jgi:hypothetical protein
MLDLDFHEPSKTFQNRRPRICPALFAGRERVSVHSMREMIRAIRKADQKGRWWWQLLKKLLG